MHTPSMNKARQTKNNGATLGFEATLWAAADKLRGHMDAAEYKHVVLGLVFLKYISDAFEVRRAALAADPEADPEDPDEYVSAGAFWVPKEARWETLHAAAKSPEIGVLVDMAMDAIERDNNRLKGVLPKDYARPTLDKTRLGELIDLDRRRRARGRRGPFQRHPRAGLRVLPRPVRIKRGEEGRRVLHAQVRGEAARRDDRAVPGARVRPVLWLKRDVRPVRAVHSCPRRSAERHLGLRSRATHGRLRRPPTTDENGDRPLVVTSSLLGAMSPIKSLTRRLTAPRTVATRARRAVS